MTRLTYFTLILSFLIFSCSDSRLSGPDGVEAILYKSDIENQPLIVGLGGSEGGNAWTSDRWKPTREKFLANGYAFLAVGYFAADGTPRELDRINLDNIHAAIKDAQKDHQIDDQRVALIGGSKGAELALLLGSYFPDIKCVVSMVGSHASFPALTLSASTSSWTYKGAEVPYVPATWSSLPAILRRDLREAFTIMMEDSAAVENALIKVENIRGPIILISATQDEMWPSTEMSDQVIERLQEKNFPYHSEHIKIKGGHTEVLNHFDRVFEFLNENFPTHQ